MAMIGSAAMLLWYDIVPESVAEHDDWHTRQHFPERVGIPGFLRAQRWVAEGTSPRYLVSYEVRDLDVLSSTAYRDRLDNPTPWTQRVMPQFRGMVRGFCTYGQQWGSVLGAQVLSIRYGAEPGRGDDLRDWLAARMPAIIARHGVASVHMLASARQPDMTAEQRLRGRDVGVEQVLLVTGYAHEPLAGLLSTVLQADALQAQGAARGLVAAVYRLACRSDAAALTFD